MRKFKWVASLLILLSSPAWATAYFLSPSGSDGNNGLSTGAAWASPNHAVNCGDTLTAAVGSYSNSSFTYNKWGTVTCTANNNVAWVICATFDGCKITATGSSVMGMAISQSYWGVQGFEVTATQDTNTCFFVYPSNSVSIHHIIFANNIANGCYAGGFGTVNDGSFGVDYLAIVGNIVYNAAQGTAECYSGISVAAPKASDTLPGTHIYIGWNYSFENVDPATCAGVAATDGEGIILDTLTAFSYVQQIAIENNLVMYNGSYGIIAFSAGGPIYMDHNTAYGDMTQSGHAAAACGEIEISTASKTEAFQNIAQTVTPAGCGGSTAYAYYVVAGDATDHVYQNWGYDSLGNNSGSASSGGFAFGPNNAFGASPSLSSPTKPSAPSCGSFSSVPTCMATVKSNFSSSAAPAYGFQSARSGSVYNPLFPQWLSNVNLPAGLVSLGSLTGSSLSGGTNH